jgi:hypothetical protein
MEFHSTVPRVLVMLSVFWSVVLQMYVQWNVTFNHCENITLLHTSHYALQQSSTELPSMNYCGD